MARWAGRGPVAVVVRPDRLAFGVYGRADGPDALADLRAGLDLPA
jgi:hypothetical protein